MLNKTCTVMMCMWLLFRSFYMNMTSINNTNKAIKFTLFTVSLAWFNTISWLYGHLTNFCIKLTKQEEICFIIKSKLPFEVQDLSQLYQAFSGILANISKFPVKLQKYIISKLPIGLFRHVLCICSRHAILNMLFERCLIVIRDFTSLYSYFWWIYGVLIFY